MPQNWSCFLPLSFPSISSFNYKLEYNYIEFKLDSTNFSKFWTFIYLLICIVFEL